MKFRHSAIVCENIDRMEEFYKIFEFKNLSAKLEVGSYIEDLTKIKNNKLFWKKYVNQEGDILGRLPLLGRPLGLEPAASSPMTCTKRQRGREVDVNVNVN